MHKIGEVAELAKVSIRLLRHYDEIGLLVPSGRSEAGYRLYAREDLQRLQQILFYRTLEFPLQEIQKLMQAPDFDRHAALLQQRELLGHKAQQLGAVLELIDKTIAEIDPKTGKEKPTMSNKEMFEVFPDMKPEYQDEAQERWGNTAAWKQSAARFAKYTKADMERMKQELAHAYGQLEEVFAAGTKPDAPAALAAIEAVRLLSDKWFYDTSKEMHVKGTEFTSNDERFVRNIDKNCPGLAAWMHQAAKANFAKG
jgi:MerR family transcriptional regulator, thiopeptide resistance regulator